MKNITVHLSPKDINTIDDLILNDLFANRSEFVRAAIRKLLLKHSHLLFEKKEEHIPGRETIVET